MMFTYIAVFILGAVLGSFISLLMVASSKINQEKDYYQEGFLDGYKKGKEEK